MFTLVSLVVATIQGIKVDVRSVESHSKIGIGNIENPLSSLNLKSSKSPGHLCAHESLQQIVDKCYSYDLDRYTYRLCPFQNITQHEKENRWNSYRGILGIWSHWEFSKDFTEFNAGVYDGGDNCGADQIPRSVTVKHDCGKRTQVANVSEPETCQYKIVFSSPLFCHNVFKKTVYALNDPLQEEFLTYDQEFSNGILTAEGLIHERKDTLRKWGCLHETFKFDTLEQCSNLYTSKEKQYQKLYREYAELKQMLTDNGLILPSN